MKLNYYLNRDFQKWYQKGLSSLPHCERDLSKIAGMIYVVNGWWKRTGRR